MWFEVYPRIVDNTWETKGRTRVGGAVLNEVVSNIRRENTVFRNVFSPSGGEANDQEAVREGRPSWNGAPVWANCLAQNKDTTWWWFECKPVVGYDGWDANGGRFAMAYADLENPNWEDTLEKRP